MSHSPVQKNTAHDHKFAQAQRKAGIRRERLKTTAKDGTGATSELSCGRWEYMSCVAGIERGAGLNRK